MKGILILLTALVTVPPTQAGDIDSAEPPGASAPANTAATVPDPRVATALKSLGYEYSLTADQDFKLVFEVSDDKRTQVVIVNSNTEIFDKAEIREVWSPSLTIDDPIDAAFAQRLLKANDTYKLGAWRLWSVDKKSAKPELYVVFAAQIDANAPASMLSAALDMVSQKADELEKEIAKVDEH
ncbi:MAG: hypothetical protein ACRET4_05505 [Steroidobacteraceae bacterium]